MAKRESPRRPRESAWQTNATSSLFSHVVGPIRYNLIINGCAENREDFVALLFHQFLSVRF